MTSYFSGFYPSETADGAKGSAAFTGTTNIAILQLYKRSATTLSNSDKPNGVVTYTFSTATSDLSAITNGWTTTIPSGEDPLYVVAATAASSDPSDSIAANEWSTPVILVQNGAGGLNTATVFLFKRSNTSSPPPLPTTSATYTFATGIALGSSSSGNTVAPYLDGWTQTAPDSGGSKYLFMTTATAIGTGSNESIAPSEWAAPKVLAQHGAQGYTGYLTNESHTLTASSAGAVTDYTGATGEFKVFLDGVGDISSFFTLSTVVGTNTQGLTITYPAGTTTYTITGGFDDAEDTASVTIRATGSGAYSLVTLDKVFSLTKAKSGINGESPKLISLSSDRQLIAYNGAGSLNPAIQTTTLSVTKQNTSSTVNWTIKDTLGNTLTPATYLSATTGDSITMTAANFQAAISVNASQGVVITATLTDGTVTVSDKVTIMKVQAGANGSNGTSPLIYSISTSTPVIVKDAIDAATAGSYSSVTIQGKKYDGIVTSNYGWITVTANGDTEATTATDTAGTPFTLSPTTTAGKSSYTIKMYNQATVSGATLLDTQTLTVVFKGPQGVTGPSARAVSLSVGTQAFAYDSSGAIPSPANTTATATALNTSGTVYYEFVLDGSSVQNNTSNTYTYVPKASFSNMPDTLVVNIREGGTGTTILASDTIALSGLKNTINGTDGTDGTDGIDGLNGLTAIVSNAAHTLPTTNTGTVTYTGSGTTLKLYEGTTELAYDGVGTSNGTWNVVTTATNITRGTLSDSGTFVTVGDHSGMTANNASISYNIVGKRANGAAINITVLQTFSKAIQGDNGAAGLNARAVSLSAAVQAFAYDSSGATPAPVNTTLTATALNTSGTVYYEFVVEGTTAQNTTGNTYTYVPQASFSNMPDTVRVNVREGGTGTTILASDTIAITGLKNTVNGNNGADGLSALTPIVSNAAHTLPTTNAGVITYTGSGTTVRLYEGTTELVFDGVGTANGTWKVSTAGTNIVPGTVTDSGNYFTIGNHSGMTAATTASVAYNLTGKRANGTAIDITVVQTFSKSIQGDNGNNGANAVVAILSNEAHVFPASSSGAVSSYVGSGTLIRVYEGATELSYDGVGNSNGTWTVSTVVDNITRGTLTDSGTFVTVGQHSGVADATDISTIVYTIVGKTSTGAAINLTKNQTFSKARSGASITGAAATSAYLTKEAQSLFAYAEGTVASFANANGLLKIYSGTSDVTASATSFSATASGCTGTINTADNSPVNGQPKGYYQVTAMSADNATLTLSATYGGSTFTKVFTLTKSKVGYEIVSSLPTTNLFQGRMVFLTTDNKLYRYNGSAFTSAVPALDITGTIESTQISDSAITSPKIYSGAIQANRIQADNIATNAIVADKIQAGAIESGKLASTEISSMFATIGTLRTATTGARTEISDNIIKVFDGNNVVRVKIGNLAL